MDMIQLTFSEKGTKIAFQILGFFSFRKVCPVKLVPVYMDFIGERFQILKRGVTLSFLFLSQKKSTVTYIVALKLS